MSTDLITVEQAAALIPEATPRKVRDWCAKGHLQAQRLGRDWVIRQADAERFRPPLRGNPQFRRKRRHKAKTG